MAETFHYLLMLDSSVLDRGRDARQSLVSARRAHRDQSKHPANSLNSIRVAGANCLVTLSESAGTPNNDKPKTRQTPKICYDWKHPIQRNLISCSNARRTAWEIAAMEGKIGRSNQTAGKKGHHRRAYWDADAIANRIRASRARSAALDLL